MNIIKRLAKLALKKAQRVRNPEAVGAWLEQNPEGRNPSKTGMYAIAEGIKRNEWNSPDGLEGSMKRYGKHHGTSPKRKKGHKYTYEDQRGHNKPLSDKEREDTTAGEKAYNKRYGLKGKKAAPTKKTDKAPTRKKATTKPTTKPTPQPTATPTKISVENLVDAFGKGDRYNTKLEEKIIEDSRESIRDLAGYEAATSKKREEYNKIYRDANTAADKLSSTIFEDDKKAFRSLLKPITDLRNLKSTLEVEKSKSSSRRLLNILKETATVDNDQLEKDFIHALNQAMQKHSDDFGVATGNNEILKNIEKDKKVEKILPALAGAAVGSLLFSNKTSQEGKKKKTLKKGEEGYQAKQNLDRVSELTDMTHDLIEDKEELPSWIQDKISEMDHHAESIYGKLKYDKKRDVKKGIGSALLAMLAGYALTPKVNPGEMTPAQQRQWERTLANQMRKKNIDLDSDTFKALQNFYKDQSDTYTRRKPAKNGVNLEKILTSPPFQGAEFDPTSHRWKKAGQVAAQAGQVNIGTGGKRRIRGAGTGAAQRSVGGHKRGIVREARRGIAARAARKKVETKTAGRASRIKAYKKLTRKK